jgi:hypothetical protein
VLVETLYLGRLFHPDKFGRLDLEKEGNEIYEEFYREPQLFTKLMKLLDFHEWTQY